MKTGSWRKPGGPEGVLAHFRARMGIPADLKMAAAAVLLAALAAGSMGCGGGCRPHSTFEASASEDGEISNQLQHTMKEIAAAARSIRLLVEYLERHPEAMLQGKSGNP